MKTVNLFIAISLISGNASAANFSFIGNLNNDDAVQEFNFEVEGTAREVTLRTWSYAGGTNAQGQGIANGGFDPVVSLFNSSTGAFISFNDDSGLVADPVSGAAYDSFLAANLSAGSYTATVTQFQSFPVQPLLSNGFGGSFAENFSFRTSQWALDVSNPGPPIAARALAVTHTCMFDAWAAYDKRAKGTRLRDRLQRPANEHIAANKEKAISHAAYKCLSDLFPSQVSSFNSLMSTLGYDPADNTMDTSTPVGIANVAAEAVIEFRHRDGSNQLGDINGGAPYSDYSGYAPVNTSSQINDPDRWQPLLVGSNEQVFVTPYWGDVKPYALASGSHYRRKIPLPANYYLEPDRYRIQAQQIIQHGMYLTDEKKAIVEYWADGPFTETPPGHWTLFAIFVSERDSHTVDQDVKMFFALTNAIFDASIVTWDTKRHFDYVRPITAIHFLFAGQTIQSWQGPVDGSNWRPYFVASVVTPPFPENDSR